MFLRGNFRCFHTWSRNEDKSGYGSLPKPEGIHQRETYSCKHETATRRGPLLSPRCLPSSTGSLPLGASVISGAVEDRAVRSPVPSESGLYGFPCHW
ncbi:hypothetical protein GN956_G23690 [Arapaima gigas]